MNSARPTVEWGPALVMHREEVARYTSGFMVDPWGNDERKVAPVFEGQVSVPANRPLTDASQETTVVIQ